jgi:hypothetical protein
MFNFYCKNQQNYQLKSVDVKRIDIKKYGKEASGKP